MGSRLRRVRARLRSYCICSVLYCVVLYCTVLCCNRVVFFVVTVLYSTLPYGFAHHYKY